MKKGTLFVLSGPSGVGKGTVRKFINLDKINTRMSVSMTTREPRPSEREGVDYFFVSKDRFDQAVDQGELLEHAQFSGNDYGTPRQAVIDALNGGDNIFLEIETQGAEKVMDLFPEAVTIFLAPPTWEDLVSRITGRGTEDPKQIEQRLETAKGELKKQDRYTYTVINDVPERAAEEIMDLMDSNIKKNQA